jgi:glutamate racemase
MVKPAAAQTKSKVIAVCATPTTLASPRYAELKAEFAGGITVLEPDCADWSALIQADAMNEKRLRESIDPALEAGADIIVLACTHYHWIEDEIKRLTAGRAEVMQPEAAILRQLKRVLGRQP